MQIKHKIAFVGNSIKTMCNFRQPLIETLANEGYEVTIIANDDSDDHSFTKAGVKFIPIEVDWRGLNPVSDIKLLRRLKRIYRREKFDFILHYTIKPVIYGTIAAHAAQTPSLSVITGSGYAFLQKNWLRRVVILLYRYAFRFPEKVWFLNTEDQQLFIDEHIINIERTDILDSEGVDTQRFAPKEKSEKTFSFIYLGRLLWAKGVGEFVEAAKILHKKYPDVKFKILGKTDGIDSAIDVMPTDLEQWEKDDVVSYLGETRDVVPFITESDCLVQPSYYREGVPRTLLEAASMGKPIITTDSVGCRETIIDGKTGFLCQPRNASDLAEKMEQMILLSAEQRIAMGQAGRQLVLNRFDNKIVHEKYLQYLQIHFDGQIKQTSECPHGLFNASIVLYKTPFDEVAHLVDALRQNESVGQIFLVDNSPQMNQQFASLPATYIFNNKNLGYGRAHNIALRQTLEQGTPYHLVMNSDILLRPDTIERSLAYMQAHPNVGMLMPQVYYPNGEIQHLCKLLPTPWNLICRRFLPKKIAERSNRKFELRDFGYNRLADIPFLSGCFMLMRSDALKQVGLFDERFFLYMEDVDLSRRMHTKFRTIFFPDASIVHKHAHGSYKNQHLLYIHTVSSCRYFNKWGWFADSERKMINQQVQDKIENGFE